MCHRETPKHQSGTRGGQQETTSIPSYTTMTGHEKPAFRQSISPLKPKKKVMGNAGTVFLLQVATQVSFLMDSVDPVLFCRDGELCEEHTYQSDTDNSYLTISDTDNGYLTISDTDNSYLNISDTDNSYLTLSDTDNSYLTISDTDNSYLTVSIILITAISLSLILITAISLSLILITAISLSLILITAISLSLILITASLTISDTDNS